MCYFIYIALKWLLLELDYVPVTYRYVTNDLKT